MLVTLMIQSVSADKTRKFMSGSYAKLTLPVVHVTYTLLYCTNNRRTP